MTTGTGKGPAGRAAAPADTKAPTIEPDATSSAIPAAVDTRTDAEKQADEELAAANRDTAGANLIEADAEGDIAAGNLVLTPTDVPVLEGEANEWEKVVIVTNAPERLPAHKEAKVIIAERRTQPDEKGLGAGQHDAEAVYSKNADAYVGHAQFDKDGGEINVFPDASGKPVFLIGGNVRQFGLGGVSRQPGFLSVGPGSSIVAAANLALQKGAKEVRITGMTDHDKAIVGPWLDKIAGEFDSLDYGGEPREGDDAE